MKEYIEVLLRRSALLQPRQGQPDGANQLLKDLQNPFQNQLQAESIFIALGTSVGVMLLIVICFSLLRPHNSAVYAPKVKHADQKHAPPAIGRGIFSWFSPVMKTKEDVLVEKVGLDAAIFLRFTRMCRNMLLCLSLIGCGVLIPVHVTRSFHFGNNNGKYLDQAFADMTPQNVQGEPLWSHVVASYLIDFVVMFFLWWNYRRIARLKKTHFLSSEYQNSLHSRSVWLTDIAKADRTDEGILRITDSVEQTASIPQAAIARNVKELPKLIEEHTKMVKRLESILAKYLKDPDNLPATRPMMKPSKKDHRAERSAKVDAIEYLTGRIKDLEVEIKDVRESIDKRNPMGYGFATYERIDEASRVAYAGRNKHPNGAMIRLAPKPSDLIWDNLALSKHTRRSRGFVIDFWIVVLTIIWIAPNALIAIFLTNFARLGAVWPSFQASLASNRVLWAIIQAIASPALLSLVYILLPIIFRRMSTRAGDLTKTLRERHVTQKLFAFFVFNNLIVVSVFSTLWGFVSEVIKNQHDGKNLWESIENAKFATLMLVSLCSTSPFWLTYLLQRNLGAAVDLAQLWGLFWRWFSRKFMHPTPRQEIEWTAPDWFDYASYYNYFLFYTTVALCYATVQPLVLPVTALYFALDAPLKKYLLLYVFVTKTESGGRLWNIVFNRVLVATLLANCVAALVVKGGWPQSTGSDATPGWLMLAAMAPLPFLLLGFKLYCKRAFADRCKYYHLALPATSPEDHPTGAGAGKTHPHGPVKRAERVGVRFGHPALYATLITPMVHARAASRLAEIYGGRTASDDSAARYGYAEYDLQPMSEQRPGKPAPPGGAGGVATGAGGKDLFEVVPEHALDFGYFKDRADFGDEHGGAGELFGRPADLVSERGGTPRPFTPDSLSRGGTPPPGYPPGGPGGYHRQASSGPPGGDGDFIGRRPVPGRAPPSGAGAAAGPYRMPQANESQRGLLRHAGGGGSPGAAGSGAGSGSRDQSPVGSDGRPTPGGEQPPYGMDRWRTGGQGYFGVSGQADEDVGYAPYRPAARGPGGY